MKKLFIIFGLLAVGFICFAESMKCEYKLTALYSKKLQEEKGLTNEKLKSEINGMFLHISDFEKSILEHPDYFKDLRYISVNHIMHYTRVGLNQYVRIITEDIYSNVVYRLIVQKDGHAKEDYTKYFKSAKEMNDYLSSLAFTEFPNNLGKLYTRFVFNTKKTIKQ